MAIAGGRSSCSDWPLRLIFTFRGCGQMGVFAWPYRVLFHDTMAYGTHHFLTNFKFQCEAREHLFFKHWMATPEARAESEDMVLLTHEGYTRNLPPVAVGDTVAILPTPDNASPSSV